MQFLPSKMALLPEKGIMTAHAETAYPDSIYSWIGKEKNLQINLSVSEFISNNSIILPLHHKIGDDQISFIGEKIKEGISTNR